MEAPGARTRSCKLFHPSNAIWSPVLPNYVGVARNEARGEIETKTKQETRKKQSENGSKQGSNQKGAKSSAPYEGKSKSEQITLIRSVSGRQIGRKTN